MELSTYVAKNKVDAFNAWLDSGRNWDECKMVVTRKHSSEQESLQGWVATSGRDLVTQFGQEKAKSLMDKRVGQGLCYDHEDFPGDELERFYYMKKPKEMNKRSKVADEAKIEAAANLDDAMLKHLTEENDGIFRLGGLPEGHAASSAGQKALLEGLGEPVAAAPKKKAKKDEKAETVKPKTTLEKAIDLQADILAESTSARKKSMSLGAVNYAGELAAGLLRHAVSMEKHYKLLQKATSNKLDDDTFFEKIFKKVEEERAWFKQAEARNTRKNTKLFHKKNVLKRRYSVWIITPSVLIQPYPTTMFTRKTLQAAADSILSGIKRASKKGKEDKEGKNRKSSKSGEKKAWS